MSARNSNDGIIIDVSYWGGDNGHSMLNGNLLGDAEVGSRRWMWRLKK